MLFLLMFSDVQVRQKLLPQPWHFQLELCDYPYEIDIYDKAMSNVWKVFQEKAEKNGTLAEKNTKILLVPQQRYQTFQTI